MRLKNVPGSREAIAESEYTIKNEESMKGKWHELFGNNNPIHIEIGSSYKGYREKRAGTAYEELILHKNGCGIYRKCFR